MIFRCLRFKGNDFFIDFSKSQYAEFNKSLFTYLNQIFQKHLLLSIVDGSTKIIQSFVKAWLMPPAARADLR